MIITFHTLALNINENSKYLPVDPQCKGLTLIQYEQR